MHEAEDQKQEQAELTDYLRVILEGPGSSFFGRPPRVESLSECLQPVKVLFDSLRCREAAHGACLHLSNHQLIC